MRKTKVATSLRTLPSSAYFNHLRHQCVLIIHRCQVTLFLAVSVLCVATLVVRAARESVFARHGVDFGIGELWQGLGSVNIRRLLVIGFGEDDINLL